MLSINNNRELRGNNKIALGLNLRQLVAVSLCGFILLIIYLNIEFPIEEMMAITIVLCFIAWYFGWHNNAGLNGEDLLLIRIKNLNENNTKRKYVTKNQYVLMMNTYHVQQNNNNLRDKKLKKQYKQMEKKRKNKKSNMVSFM